MNRKRSIFRSGFWAIALALLMALGAIALSTWSRAPASSGDPVVLVASLDTNASHFRNRVVHHFAETLRQRSQGQLRLQVYESGQLMSDRDVAKALVWGLVDFALPADSKIARFEPNASLLSLPLFYGLPRSSTYAIADGPIGGRVRAAVEQDLDVRVLLPLLDLGFTATYSTGKPLAGPQDYQGLKIRFPGGAGPAALFATLGAAPLAVPFPDVPLALAQGSLDGIQSTHETVRSARLWDAGLAWCLEDNANLMQYVPLVSNRALERLSQAQQELLAETWQEVVGGSRSMTQRAQLAAREELAANGINCVAIPGAQEPDAADPLAPAMRRQLLSASRAVAGLIGMDAALVDDTVAALGLNGLEAEH